MVVANCDHLGAVGQWQEVTPADVKQHPSYTGTITSLVNPQNPAIVYILTDERGVFKSTDCGATWNKSNTGRNAMKLDSGRIWNAILDESEPDTIYALTGYGPPGIWKSTNGGVDWDQMLPDGSEVAKIAGGFVEAVYIDPVNHLHLLLNYHNNCADGHTPVCFGETTDGGKTWKVLDFPQNLSSSWAEGSYVAILPTGTWLYNAEGKTFRSTDHGAQWSVVGSGFSLGGNRSTPVRTPEGAYWAGSLSGIIRSNDDGATWSTFEGGIIGPVIGHDNHLYAASAANQEVIYTADYKDLPKFSKLASPGLPDHPAQYAYTFSSDPVHHLLYLTLQASGTYRVLLQ